MSRQYDEYMDGRCPVCMQMQCKDEDDCRARTQDFIHDATAENDDVL